MFPIRRRRSDGHWCFVWLVDAAFPFGAAAPAAGSAASAGAYVVRRREIALVGPRCWVFALGSEVCWAVQVLGLRLAARGARWAAALPYLAARGVRWAAALEPRLRARHRSRRARERCSVQRRALLQVPVLRGRGTLDCLRFVGETPTGIGALFVCLMQPRPSVPRR